MYKYDEYLSNVSKSSQLQKQIKDNNNIINIMYLNNDKKVAQIFVLARLVYIVCFLTSI